MENHPHFHAELVDVEFLLRNQLVVHIDFTGCRLLQQVQTAEKGRFAGAGRPDHDDFFAFLDVLCDAVQNDQLSEILVEIMNAYHVRASSFRFYQK